MSRIPIANSAFSLESLIIRTIAHQDNAEALGTCTILSPPPSPPTLASVYEDDLECLNLSQDPSPIPIPPPPGPSPSSTAQNPKKQVAGPKTIAMKKDNLKKDDESLRKSRLQRRSITSNLARARKREDHRARIDGQQQPCSKMIKRHTDAPDKVVLDIDLEDLPATTTGYVGLDNSSGSRKAYSLEDLVGEGSKYKFKLVEWDGSTLYALVDKCDRIIGVLAGHPKDENWPLLHGQAAEALECRRGRCYVPKKDRKRAHRRGAFVALACGVSYGGGQKVPGNLQHEPQNAELLDELNGLKPFKRMAGFASSVMATWGFELHAHYAKTMDALYRHYPGLIRVFPTSIFSAVSYNFGPRTVCFKHKDYANLAYGWCAVTALGSFDYTKGGHLILWDLGLVIEFPPGSTILLPSAIVAHSNVPIAKEERCYSFAQYTAGALFRWVDNGFQTRENYLASLSPEEKISDEEKQNARWKDGISLFSTL